MVIWVALKFGRRQHGWTSTKRSAKLGGRKVDRRVDCSIILTDLDPVKFVVVAEMNARLGVRQ